MDLPVNFPHGTRFWQLIIDAVADLTTGKFMLLDGAIVSGDRAERLRREIERDGVEISEETFRRVAPASLAERCKAIRERAERDPEFAKALATLAKEEGLFDECERVMWDSLRNAPDRQDQREAAKLLLKIAAKKQNADKQ